MAVDVSANGAAFHPEAPKQLFALPANVGDWNMTADGKRFTVSRSHSTRMGTWTRNPGEKLPRSWKRPCM
jgi:hypothetical protein